MNKFEQALNNYYSAEQLSNIQKIKIGIAGAGGLGSNIAACLARSGFKDFEIIDFDRIEMKNLNRQCYFLSEVGKIKVNTIAKRLKHINPDIITSIHKIHLSHENILGYFQDRDIIFEAFDNVASKKLLMESFGNSNKLLIFGSGMAGISNKKDIKIKQLKNNIFIVGDRETFVGKDNPPMAPRVTACAALMASVALESVLLKKI